MLPPITLCSCSVSSSSDSFSNNGAEKIDLNYAQQFSVEKRYDGCWNVSIGDDRFIIVPEDITVPDDTDGTVVLKQPLKDIYLASSSVMDLFSGLDSLDSVTMTSTDINNWALPDIREALENGEMTYVGKYNAPDYEALVENNCGIAIENTMIYHSPDTKEQIQQLGIPVMVERSSYESHPLGRLEWIKLYGLLIGEYDKAVSFFNEKKAAFDSIELPDISDEARPTAAFFYISSNGYVNIRKPNDYIARMIELAGGRYIFTADMLNIDDNSLSTMNIQFETFYEIAKDADYLIYNSTIDGGIDTVDALIEKNSLLSDFKSVQNGNVWCTEMNMFQQTTGAADMITDINRILTGNTDNISELKYLHRLK